MFRNYFQTAWRNLFKNKISSIINISGLAVGLATSILILLVVLDELNYDAFNKNRSSIYLVMKNQKQVDGISTGESTAGPLAASLRSQMPETKYASRIAYFDNEVIRVSDKTLFGSGIYAEPDIFKMMTFPSVEGNPVNALQSGNELVVTEATAKELFGNVQAMGRQVTLGKESFIIGAVIRDIPSNSSIQFDMAFPFSYFQKNNQWLTHWDDNRVQTWVQLKQGSNVERLNAKLTRLLQVRSDDKSVSLFVYPLSMLHLYNSFSNGKPNGGGNVRMLMLLGALGFFVLLIACINFMNIATARSERRSREVGVRKVLGASRSRIIVQFISEAMVTTLLALLLAIVIVQVTLPYFNEFTGKKIIFTLSDSTVWLVLATVGLFTGLLAGSYPAFFMSAFKAIKVLKGTYFEKRGGGMRKVLVTVQFVISIFLIIATIVIYKQINYVRDRPLGYSQDNLLDITANGELPGKFGLFRTELEKIPGVRQVAAGNDNVVNFGGSITGMDYPGKIPGQEISVIVSTVSYGWTRTFNIAMLEGRDFSAEFPTDSNACIINEATVRKMNLKEPVLGNKIGGKIVVGVYKDFVYNNPSGIIAPMMLTLGSNDFSHFFVRVENGGVIKKTIVQIERAVNKLNPGYPFDYSMTKQIYLQRFKEWDALGAMTTLFGCMAIFIASLGLFGLSAFLTERRGKEISIRKTFGASNGAIWFLLSRDFLKPVFIALLVVVPVCAWLSNSLLRNIDYHTSITWWMFALAVGIVLATAMITVGFQAIRAAVENPVNKLRAE